jgi:hypothetical protein
MGMNYEIDEKVEFADIEVGSAKAIAEQVSDLVEKCVKFRSLASIIKKAKSDAEDSFEISKMESIANADPMRLKTEKSKEAAFFAENSQERLKIMNQISELDHIKDMCIIIADAYKMKCDILLACAGLLAGK